MKRRPLILGGDDALASLLGIAGCLLFIAGAKAWLIAVYGSDTPFSDEWLAEGELAFKPYLNGTLKLHQLFAHHNEHRIFLTRLVHVGLLDANGTWSPLLEMLVNALVHTLAIGIFIGVIRGLLETQTLLAFALFAMIVVSIPFGFESTLSGFQFQFYIKILLALPCLYLLLRSQAWSPGWWLGLLTGTASYFSTASGALTFLPVIGLLLLQRLASRHLSLSEWAACLVLGIVSAVMIFDVPKAVTPFGSQSPAQFLASTAQALSWPVAAHHWTIVPRIVGAVFVQLPIVVLAVWLLRTRAELKDRRWFLVAVGLWVGLQVAALALGRAEGMMSHRYFDVYVIGLLANAACCFVLLADSASIFPKWKHPARAVFGFWLIAVLYGGSQKALSFTPLELAEWSRNEKIRTDNLKGFLATGDMSYLRGKPMFETAYVSPDELAAFTRDPAIRAILSPGLFGKIEVAPVRDAALKIGPMLMPVGLALFILGLVAARRRPVGAAG